MVNHEQLFTGYYNTNNWGSSESFSGHGSTTAATAAIREVLPWIIEYYGIESILDIPCGDFNWMQTVALGTRYTGADIVHELVAVNQKKYGREDCSFVHLDLLTDDLPKSDLIFCRDCLVHFSFADVQAALANVRRSGSKYLLATTFTDAVNHDIPTGQWTGYNLQATPFDLGEPVAIFSERYPPAPTKSLGLWKLEN